MPGQTRAMYPYLVSPFDTAGNLTQFSSEIFLVSCWPTPSNDGTVEVSIEYELENEHISLYDTVISIPLP